MKYEERVELYNKFKDVAYYFLIAIVSLISVVFLPFIGSALQGEFKFPTTVAGWVIYILSKLCISIINVLIFYSFVKQARVNIKNDPKYLEGLKLMEEVQSSECKEPRSPKKYFTGIWATKGTVLFITTCATCFALTEALLTFDFACFLTYIFTIIMGIIFGYIQMRSVEDYWISEYPVYAQKRYNKIMKEKEKTHDNDRQCEIQESTGTSPEESN